jgi:hypothetical protein
MGWNSAGEIFDPVAQSLIDLGATPEVKRKVLGDLIGALQDGDWDTEDESLEQFKDDPAIVAAFADHDVHLEPDDEDDEPTDSDSDVLALIGGIASRLQDGTDEGEYHAASLIYDLAHGRKTVAEARTELADITFRHV